MKNLSYKKIFIYSAVSLIIIGFSTVLWFYSTIKTTAVQIHDPLPLQVKKMRTEPISMKQLDPISIVLLGVDEREDDRGRSDTIIVLTVNPTLETSKMLSIPRDTYVEIVGMSMHDKINHSYAFGGVQMAHETVQNFLQIPIDYVVSINMEGFVGLIDAIDGIHVQNSLPFQVDDFTYPAGELNLNGEESLAYVRMRYDDPNGDFGRQDRQKDVLHAIFTKLVSVESIFAYRNLLDVVGDNVRTNLTFDEMKEIQKNYSASLKAVEPITFKSGEGKIKNEVWYYMTDTDELEDVQKELQQHLE